MTTMTSWPVRLPHHPSLYWRHTVRRLRTTPNANMCSGDVFGLIDCLQFAEVKTQVNSSCFSTWCERVAAIVTVLTVLCLRQLVTSLSARRPGHVWSIVEHGTVTGLSPFTWFPPVSVVAPVLHNHLYLNTGFIRMLSKQSLGNFEQCNAFCDITDHWTVK
jgi:hypothetical protein